MTGTPDKPGALEAPQYSSARHSQTQTCNVSISSYRLLPRPHSQRNYGDVPIDCREGALRQQSVDIVSHSLSNSANNSKVAQFTKVICFDSFVELYNDNLVDLYWLLDNKKAPHVNGKPPEPPRLEIKQDAKKMVQKTT